LEGPFTAAEVIWATVRRHVPDLYRRERLGSDCIISAADDYRAGKQLPPGASGRAYYYFEFFVTEPGSASPVRIHADYSDKGFYSGDPAISDGDTVQVTYLKANEEAASIRELAGRHAGWYYQADLKPIGPPILVIAGLTAITAAVGGLITDIQAKTEGEPNAGTPGSILGL